MSITVLYPNTGVKNSVKYSIVDAPIWVIADGTCVAMRVSTQQVFTHRTANLMLPHGILVRSPRVRKDDRAHWCNL